MKQQKILFTAALLACSQWASAACQVDSQRNFSAAMDVSGGLCKTVSADTAEQFFKLFDDRNLKNQAIGYTGSEAATFSSYFNGVTLKVGFPTAAASTLSFAIPELGIDLAFNGTNRDHSVDLLEDYLKKNDLIGKLMKLQAAATPNSPITGPGGLMAGSVEADFSQQFDIGSQIVKPAGSNKGADSGDNKWSLGASAGHTTLKNHGTVETMTLPLSYAFNMDANPHHQLSFSLPLTQVTTNGAQSYHVGLGVSYRFPLTENWSMAPGIRYGVVGSVDLASIAAMQGASLTSVYVLPFDGFQIALANMVGQYKTLKFKTEDYSFDPGIKNNVLRNGIMLSQPVNMLGHQAAVEYSLIDTRYSGTEIYVKSTQEVGLTVGTLRSAGDTADSYYRAGVSYFKGRDASGYRLNVGFWF